MDTAPIIAASVVASIVFVGLLLVVIALVLKVVTSKLRVRGEAALAKLGDVVLSNTLAQSFGQQSLGVTQARGAGALALTRDELYFLLYVPERELRIPLSAIEEISFVRSHLGKTQGVDLLHVRFAGDAIAWRLPDAGDWKTKIESARAAR